MKFHQKQIKELLNTLDMIKNENDNKYLSILGYVRKNDYNIIRNKYNIKETNPLWKTKIIKFVIDIKSKKLVNIYNIESTINYVNIPSMLDNMYVVELVNRNEMKIISRFFFGKYIVLHLVNKLLDLKLDNIEMNRVLSRI